MNETLFIILVLAGLALVAIVKILFWVLVCNIVHGAVVETIAEGVRRAGDE